MRTPAALLCFVLALAACSARNAGGELQQWTDDDGNVRYTTSPDQVPRSRRDTLTRVEPGQSAEQNAAALPGARTEPRPAPNASEWLRGEEAAAGDATAPAAEAPAAAPDAAAAASAQPLPDAGKLDARIRSLENELEAAETELAQANGAEPADPAQVDAIARRRTWIQEQLEAARQQRAVLPPVE